MRAPHDSWLITTALVLLVLGLSPVSPNVSALLPWCRLSVSLWRCCMLPCHLTERQLFWLSIGPSLLHSFRLSGWRMIFFFLIIISSTHLLMYDVTDDVHSSRLMWLSWLVASLNMLHSKQSCRAALASSAHTLTVFIDGLVLTLAPFSPPYSWPITAWTGCESQTADFEKLR